MLDNILFLLTFSEGVTGVTGRYFGAVTLFGSVTACFC